MRARVEGRLRWSRQGGVRYGNGARGMIAVAKAEEGTKATAKTRARAARLTLLVALKAEMKMKAATNGIAVV